MPRWWTEFEPFSATHAVVVLIFLLTVSTLCVWGVRYRDTRTELRARRLVAWCAITFQLLALGWYMQPRVFKLDESLPLHVCDICGWTAWLALATNWRWARTLTFLWGIALCTQAFVTP